MKKQDIRRIYTQKVTELLAQGYTIYPDTMNGSQGEIAHIDLTRRNEIIRVLLEKTHACPDSYDDEDAYWGDVIRLTVGRAAPDTRVGSNWDGTIWNNHLEPIFQIEWADVTGYRRNSEWYTDLEEGRRIQKLQRARSRNHRDFQNYTSTELATLTNPQPSAGTEAAAHEDLQAQRHREGDQGESQRQGTLRNHRQGQDLPYRQVTHNGNRSGGSSEGSQTTRTF